MKHSKMSSTVCYMTQFTWVFLHMTLICKYRPQMLAWVFYLQSSQKKKMAKYFPVRKLTHLMYSFYENDITSENLIHYLLTGSIHFKF